MSDVREILGGWQSDGIGFVRFELPDMHGISRSKTIPIAHAFDYAERGLNMYGERASSTRDRTSSRAPCTTTRRGTATSCCSPTRTRPR